MPRPNFHSCRLVPPSKFDKNAFMLEGKPADFVTKVQPSGLHVVLGKIDGKVTAQTILYPQEKFTEAEARKKCEDAGGIEFTPASGGEE